MTGDIVQQEGAKRVVWIDRKKNVLKLAQGEFVSLGRLEAVYKGGSNLIHQVRVSARLSGAAMPSAPQRKASHHACAACYACCAQGEALRFPSA